MKRSSDAATKYSNAQNLWSKNIFFTFFPKKTGNVFFSFILVPKRSSNFFLLLRGRKDYSKLVLNSEAANPKDLFRSSLFLKILKTFFFFASPLLFFFLLKFPIFFFFRWISTPGMFYRWKKQLSSDDSMSSMVLKLCSREANALAKISRCVFLLSMELSVTRLFGKIWPVLATF